MEQRSMTALISAFSRAFHNENNVEKVFADTIAKRLLGEEDYRQIAFNMSKGIGFFNPGFKGDEQEALRWIVDNQLSPTPIGRAAFTEKTLENAVTIGAKQYLIFAAGYDSFAYRQPDWASGIKIFEIDHPFTSKDKKQRLKAAGIELPDNLCFTEADFNNDDWINNLTACTDFNRCEISFCSLLGISYYLSKKSFDRLIKIIATIVPKGSSIVFDYQDEYTFTELAGERTKKQLMLAGSAKEQMLSGYSYDEIEKLLCECNFLIYEHLNPNEITKQFFGKYNSGNRDNKITAFDNVNYCLAVKQ